MDKEVGGGSGPNFLGGEGEEVDVEDVGEVCLGESGGLGRMAEFLSKKVGCVKRPSKG